MDFSARFSLRRNRAFFCFPRGAGANQDKPEGGRFWKSFAFPEHKLCCQRRVRRCRKPKNPDVRRHPKPMPSPVLTTKVAVLEGQARSRFGIFWHSKKIFKIHASAKIVETK